MCGMLPGDNIGDFFWERFWLLSSLPASLFYKKIYTIRASQAKYVSYVKSVILNSCTADWYWTIGQNWTVDQLAPGNTNNIYATGHVNQGDRT